jgi:hypothetical protein
MATRFPSTGKGKHVCLQAVRYVLLVVVSFALLGVVLLMIGALLLIGALALMGISLVVGVYLSVSVGVGISCGTLLTQFVKAATKGVLSASQRKRASHWYQTVLKPTLVALLRRFVRWLIPFLFWKIWQWAESAHPWGAWSPHQQSAAVLPD